MNQDQAGTSDSVPATDVVASHKKRTRQGREQERDDEKTEFVLSIDQMGLAELTKSQSHEQEKVCEYTMRTYEFEEDSPPQKLMEKMALLHQERYNLLDKEIKKLLTRSGSNK